MGIASFTSMLAIATLATTGSIGTVYSSIQDAVSSAFSTSHSTAGRATAVAQRVTPGSDALLCEAQLTAQSRSSRINLRAQPSTTSRLLGYGLVGDRVSILEDAQGPDRYTWYRVRFQDSRATGWIRSDLVMPADPSCAVSRTPDSSPAPSPRVLPDEGAGTGGDRAAARRRFTDTEVNYFLEVALGSEYGNSTAAVRRWEDNIRIQLHFPDTTLDATTEEQVTTAVEQVIDDLNALLSDSAVGGDRPVQLELVNRNPNVEFYFVRAEDFERYDSNARRGQLGHVWTWWSGDVINRSRILVSSNYLSEQERDHVIREEITQSLGILKDSWNYPNSIFYQGWTSTTRFDPLDEAVIKMLYNPSIRAGMTTSEVRQVLSQL